MPRHGDTNPHFVRPFRPENEDQLSQIPPHLPFVSLPHQGQPPPEPLHLGPEWPEPQQREPPYVEPERRHVEPAIRPKSKRQGRHSKPQLGRPLVSFHPHFQNPPPQENHPSQQTEPLVQAPVTNASHDPEDVPHPKPHGSQGQPRQHKSHDPEDQPHPRPHGSQGQPHPHQHSQRTHPHGLIVPHPQQTNLFQWSSAIFCVIFWVVIIIGGLVVLIVYLVFRPRTPKFDVSSATLNAAYLDMGYLLNADLTVLANFTNPNKKVSVDFSYLIIDLYYGTTHIATQYIEPFSAHKSESMFANVHMVVSQVRLGLLESQRLTRQIETNRATFEVKGYFRARSNFGKILRYSYWLHGDCKVVFSRPPDGVLVSRKCKTKH